MPQTLLLADDSVTIQRVIELTFADEDIKVIAVSDGDQAIARIEAAPPDIVLADVGMPGKSGYEVAAYVKSSPRLAHIPVVLLTGAFEPVDQVKAAAVGCDGVLAKPFEPQLVITRVRELLGRPAQAAPAGDPSLKPPASILDFLPAPPVEAAPVEPEPEKVEDYFDRLDAAFASFSHAPAPAAVRSAAEEAVAEEIDWMNLPTTSGASPALELAFEAAAAAETVALEAAQEPEPEPVPEPEPEPEPEVVPAVAAVAAVEELPAEDDTLDIGSFELDALEFVEPKPVKAPVVVAKPVVPEVPKVPEVLEVPEAPVAPPFAAAPVPAEPAKPVAPVVPAAPEVPEVPADVPEVQVASVVVELPSAPRALPSIADAFAAILSAEQNALGVRPEWPKPAAAPLPVPVAPVAPVITDELIDRIARRVIDQLSDRVVRETVASIASDTAERLVKEEIDRIKASIK